MPLLARIAAAVPAGGVLERQRGHLFPWVPVCLACGIGLYFGLPMEPGREVWGALGALAAVLLAGVAAARGDAPVLIAALALLAGLGLAAQRTYSVAAPVLEFRYYGPIEGRVVGIDRSASDKLRLTLDRVVLKNVPPARTPGRVRISLHGQQGFITPEPGLTVILTGHLAPPGGPVEPGGFDFRRQAWFKGLGAVGYTRTPVLALIPAEEGRAGLAVFRIRMAISRAVQEALPGQAGAVAAALTTGDRSGLSQEVLEDLRASNLAHLLAISGLHMGLLTGSVFSALRAGLALVPGVALRWPVKKIAAGGAIAAGAAYLALSGGNVATERAFVMVAVVFTAVLLDRRAITLRAVALAAVIVLALRPEALLGPGFQMSFAATTALVAVFGWLRDRRGDGERRWPRWTVPVAALVISSVVAGLATAPFAAAHFNRVPHYGLLANLLSVPLMGAVIIPGGLLAATLAPFGLGWIGLEIMRPAILWILGVASWVAELDGAVSHVVAPPPVVLPLLSLGGLFVVLWQGSARSAGLVPILVAFTLWAGTERPALLVSDSGGLLGLMTPEGRALSKPRGEGFAADSWLENDGDGADQAEAAARAGFDGQRGDLRLMLGELRIAHLTGRGAADRVRGACREADLVITSAPNPAPASCQVIGRHSLATSGALALYAGSEGPRIVSVRDSTGSRPWNRGQ